MRSSSPRLPFIWHSCSVLVIVLFSVFPLPAQNDFDGVRVYIRSQLLEHSIPSVSVAVAQHGKIIWEEGFGWANREQRIPATANTMYSVASISKPITATGLMTLVQGGKIDLDRPINDYLGDAKIQARVGNPAGATVRRVANHSSGLPSHGQFFFSDEPYQTPSYDETIVRYGNLITMPGERFKYSNLGYGILGYVEARVSGESYEDFMRETVFIKLGMTHTSVGIGPGLDQFQAIRYDEKGIPFPFFDFDHRGASAIYSSAHDLVRFGMFHLKDHLPDQCAILSDASIDEMHRPTMMQGPNRGYGIGWLSADRSDGYRVISHDGGMPGVSGKLMLVPSEDLAVVVLSNARVEMDRIADQIVKAVLPKWKVAEEEHDAPIPPFHPDTQLLGVWKGSLHTYQKDLAVTIKVLPCGDVHVKLGEQPESLLNEVQFKDGWLSGQALGDIGTGDASRRHANLLWLDVKLRGEVLNGGVTAGVDGSRPVALTQWLEVKKQ
jgi:CubicO group peptidase (beta-lactamase class C family)